METRKYEELLEKFRHAWKLINHNYIQREDTSCVHGQGKLLAILAKNEEKISQKDLAIMMNISAPSLTELIQKCLKSDFIIQEKDDLDKRYSYIRITDKGLDLLEKKKEARNSAAVKVFSMLEDVDIDSLDGLLDKLISIISEDLR